jgi:methyl-accepting chemotaxis protein
MIETTSTVGTVATPPTPSRAEIDIDQLHGFVNALRGGDFNFRLSVTPGMGWKTAEVVTGLNSHIQRMGPLIAEITRISAELAAGNFGGQAEHTFGSGPWKQLVDAVNAMATQLTEQIRDLTRTATLMAAGEVSRPALCPCHGETLELRIALNTVRERLGR